MSVQDDNTVQQQINYLKRKLNERTAFSTLSNYANIAERLSNGNINIQIDCVNRLVTFGNGTNKLWFDINEKTLNNIVGLLFADGSQINGLVTATALPEARGSSNHYSNHAISAEAFIDFINQADEKYAAKEHSHAISEVTNLQTALDSKAALNHNHVISEVTNLQTTLDSKAALNHNHAISEVTNLQTTLDSKAALNHNHDSTYIPLNSLASTVQSNSLIPTNIAVITYCQNFLTVAMIQANTELQTLLRGSTGKSAFEVWEEQQPTRYDQDGTTIIPYTYNDYLNAISGAIGAQGPKGDRGYSAFEIWCFENEYDPNHKTYQDFIDDITADSTASTIASVGTTLASQFTSWAAYSALQDQVSVLEGQVATLLSGDTAEAFVDAMNDARTATRDVTQWVSDLADRFRTHFPRATNTVQTTLARIRPSIVNMPLLTV